MTPVSVLLGSTLVVLGVCAALVVVVATTKVVRTRRARLAAALVAPYRGALIEVASGEDEGGEAAGRLRDVTGPARRAVDGAATQLLGRVRGRPAGDLVAILREHGAVERAVTDLGRRSALRRARAARLLGLCQDAGARAALEAALTDRDPVVRTCAVQALGAIGDPLSAEPVLAAVGGPGGLPAGEVLVALDRMGVGITAALLGGIVAADPRTRTVACHVSGAGGFTRALPLLRRTVATDPDPTVREAAARALGEVGRAEDVDLLVWLALPGNPTALRRACIASLGALGDVRAVAALAELCRDEDAVLAELSASVLVRIGPRGRRAAQEVRGTGPTPAVETALRVAELQAAHR